LRGSLLGWDYAVFIRSRLAKSFGKFDYTDMKLVPILKRKLGLLVLLGVVGYCLVYALAFVKLWRMEHPYKLASEWIFENVPAGSRIASPHWDDKVPVGLPGKDSAVYKMHGREYELPVYERDSGQMIDSIVKRVAASDYLTFATPRAADSIPRIPDEYPNMTALLRLLWGEKVGFKLVHTTKNRPSFLGITFNDDLADESFSVYDHPKVVVFKNEEKLSAEEILDRVKNVTRYEPLPNMNDMLLMDQGGWVAKHRMWNPSWSHYVKAVLFILVVALSFWVSLGSLFRGLPDGGLGLSLLIGLSGATAISWVFSLLNVVPFTRNGGLFVALLLIVCALIRISLSAATRKRVFGLISRHGLGALMSILVGSLVVLVMRSSDPALFGAGEYVEQAYITYLMRSSDSIPWDLSRPGKHIPLAFIDRVALAWGLRASGVSTAIALTASYVVAGGIIGGALYSFMALIVKRSISSVIGVLIAIIPAVYILHLTRDLTESRFAAAVSKDSSSEVRELAAWISDAVSGTPKVVEACDDKESVSVASSLGLPRYVEGNKEALSSGNITALCEIGDPQQAYDRMMSQGLELFVTPTMDSANTEGARARFEKFMNRPDLFARVFENQRFALFIPAFSEYYPRITPR